MKLAKSHHLVILACGLILLSQLANYVLAPAFPQLPGEFNAPVARVQQLIAMFLAGFALVQLVIGSISDSWGRRNATLLSLGFFLAGSALCAWSGSLGMLSLGLLIQAMGAGSFPTLAQAVLRDRFEQGEVVGVMSILATVTACTVAFTPMISGLILQGLSWRVMYIGLVAIIIPTCGAVFLLMPETLAREDRSPLHPRTLVKAYKGLFTNIPFVGYALALGLMTGAMAAFFAGTPFVLMNGFGLTYNQFGLWFMFAFSGFVLGTLGAPRAIRYLGWDIHRTVLKGVILASVGSMLGLGLHLVVETDPMGMLACAFVFAMGLGTALGVGRGAALSRVTSNFGVASAFVSFSIGALAALVSALAPRLDTHTSEGLFLVTMIVSLSAVVVVLLAGGLGKAAKKGNA